MTKSVRPCRRVVTIIALLCLASSTLTLDRMRYINALIALMERQQLTGSHTAMEETATQTLKIYPPTGPTLSNYAIALGKHKKSLEEGLVTKLLLKTDPNSLLPNYNSSFYYLGNMDLTRGWELYEWRLKKHEYQKSMPFPTWQGESLHGKKILVIREQGLGDVIMFARYMILLKEHGAKVTFLSPRPLAKLFADCSYIDRIITVPEDAGKQDFWTYMGSIPYKLNIRFDRLAVRIPYISPRQEIVTFWRRKVAADHNFKIGIAWHGANAHQSKLIEKIASFRSVPLEYFIGCLSDVPGVSLYSLQKNRGIDQLGSLPLDLRKSVIDFSEELDEGNGPFVDTAALMTQMDLVLTIDTSLVHVAGALGVKTWVLIPESSYWTWFKAPFDYGLFYPTVKLFRQAKLETWLDVMPRVVGALRKEVRIFKKRQFSSK